MDFLLSFIQTQPKYSGLAQYCPEALAELLSVRLCYSVESLVIFILAIVTGKSHLVRVLEIKVLRAKICVHFFGV